jgi:hypothetical protein
MGKCFEVEPIHHSILPQHVGQFSKPSGAVIDTETMEWAKNLMPPVNSTPLDDATYQVMKQHHTEKGIAHLMGSPPATNQQQREANTEANKLKTTSKRS